MAYNKTDQERLEDEESTFIELKFVQVCADKPISEWIIFNVFKDSDRDIYKKILG